jgi:hypothetical protein
MYMRLPKLASFFVDELHGAVTLELDPSKMFPPLFLFSSLCTDGKALRKFFQKLGCLGWTADPISRLYTSTNTDCRNSVGRLRTELAILFDERPNFVFLPHVFFQRLQELSRNRSDRLPCFVVFLCPDDHSN